MLVEAPSATPLDGLGGTSGCFRSPSESKCDCCADAAETSLTIIPKEAILGISEQHDEIIPVKIDEVNEPFLHRIHEKNGIHLVDLIEETTNKQEIIQNLVDLTNKKRIKWWYPEFEFIYEQATLEGLYLLYQDGRPLFSYNFDLNM